MNVQLNIGSDNFHEFAVLDRSTGDADQTRSLDRHFPGHGPILAEFCVNYHILRLYNVIIFTFIDPVPLTHPLDYGIISAMKRDIYQQLLDWKSSSRRKPLLLQGARQTGKTFILKAFGRNEYENVVYCNFEEDPGLGQFFQRDLNPERILADLSIYYDLKIRPGDDLVVFDEIQVSNRALNALKYFKKKEKISISQRPAHSLA